MKKTYGFNVALLIGMLVAAASRAQDSTHWVQLEESIARLGGGSGALIYSADGTRLAVSAHGGILIYDVHTNTEVALIPQSYPLEVAFSPDGSTFASSSFDQVIRLWDATSGQLKATLKGHPAWVGALAFSPDGATLVSGHNEGTIRLWDADSEQLLATLKGHTSYVYLYQLQVGAVAQMRKMVVVE